mgnify:CR=1 FL=1
MSVYLHGLGVPRGMLFFDMYTGDIVLDKKKKKLYIIVVGNMNFEDNNGMPIPPIGGFNAGLDNIEEVENMIIDIAFENSYLMLTKRKTFDELLKQEYEEFLLEDYSIGLFAHDPLEDVNDKIVELMVEHFEEKEEFEKCASIYNIKKQIKTFGNKLKQFISDDIDITEFLQREEGFVKSNKDDCITLLIIEFLQDIDQSIFILIHEKWAHPILDAILLPIRNALTWIPLYVLFIFLIFNVHHK